MLFETAIKMYMSDRAKRLRATTLEGYESAIRKHIAPAWAGREVESITHEELPCDRKAELHGIHRRRPPNLGAPLDQ